MNIDHKAKSVELMDAVHDWQSDEGITDASILTVTIESLQQATLYAAEQTAVLAEHQRVANLIAYQAAITAFQGDGARLSPKGQVISDALESQIEKALGLA